MPEPIAIIVGSMRWTIQPQWRDVLLGPAGLRLDDWLRHGQARIVKHGPHRSVYQVTLGAAADFYVKHNRPWNLRAWLRELIRPAKSGIEFERARQVAARGIDTIEPIALGESLGPAPAESFLVTRTLAGVQQLQSFLETALPTFEPARQARLRQRLARDLAGFVRRLHNQGITHHDLHPGNLLVRLEAGDVPRFFLVDLHAVTIGTPLDQRARTANLALLNNWFSLRASRSDRLRFWRSYHADKACKHAAAELERQTLRAQLGFWRGRDWRCLTSNRYFQQIRRAGVSGQAVRDLDPELLARLLADPDAPFAWPGATLLKDSRGSTVAELELPHQGLPRRLIYKRFRVKPWPTSWLAWLRPTPALRSWTQGHGLLERGLPTARPLLLLQRRRWGLPAEGYLLTEKIEHAATLYHFLADLHDRPLAERQRTQRLLIDRLARLIHELHRRGVSHRDLKAGNILVSSQESAVSSQQSAVNGGFALTAGVRDDNLKVWLIDLVGAQRHGNVARARRVQNLARLNASFLQSARITRTDRLRFLQTYLLCGLKGRAGWKRWWQQIEAASLAKAERNRRHGRVLA